MTFRIVLIIMTMTIAIASDGQTGAVLVSASKEATESSYDKLLADILAAGIGGFISWILLTAVTFYFTRQRLISYLLVTLNSHLRQYKDTKWLSDVKEKKIKEGQIVKLAAKYTKDDLADITDARSECLTYLWRNELVRLTKIYQRMFELEALFDGFCEVLEDYKKEGKTLDPTDVEYLQRKHDRIMSYINILPNKIDSLKDLPEDYSGILGPEYIG